MPNDGPVTQVTIPSAYEPAPIRSSFSNSGGVSRYTTGSDVEGAALIKFAQAHGSNELPTASFVGKANTGGFMSTTFSHGEATESVSTGFSKASSADNVVSGGDILSTIRSPSGRAISGPEVTRDSRITLDSGFETTIAAAAVMGIVRQNPATGYWEATANPSTGTRTPTPQEERAQGLKADQDELQARMDAEREAKEAGLKDTVPDIEPMNDDAERIMTDAVNKLGANNMDTAEAIKESIDKGDLSEALSSRMATQLGLTPQEFATQFETVKAGLIEQTQAVLGGEIGANNIREWAEQHRPQDLRKAMLDHASLGTTRGYQALQQGYMESLADTPQGRATILQSADAETRGIVENRATGKLTINIPGHGRMEWRTAVKQGFIGPKYSA
jgi:hypothetical protein